MESFESEPVVTVKNSAFENVIVLFHSLIRDMQDEES
jgi:hypothetical protein